MLHHADPWLTEFHDFALLSASLDWGSTSGKVSMSMEVLTSLQLEDLHSPML